MQINSQKTQFSSFSHSRRRQRLCRTRWSRKFIPSSIEGRGTGIIFLLLIFNLNLLAQVPTKTIKIFPAHYNSIKHSPSKVKHSSHKTTKNIPESSLPVKLTLQVEIADTELTQAYGLSHRKFLPEKQGMLFIFKAPQIGSFWGKNTLIPLDLIYIDHDHKIVQISKIQPHDLTAVPSQDKIQHALELNQGTADKYGLQVGDRLIWN